MAATMARKTSALQPLAGAQARAASPDAHVWLSASAGTGKTHVLTARVFRLLLQGVRPENILCLTFTKAGAAEMADRIHDRLAAWVQMEEGELFEDLEALHEDSGPEARDRARRLFAEVLESTGGGLRIQTIHGFCQQLLTAFPLEADLPPGFRPLDQREQAALARQTLADLAVRAQDLATIASWKRCRRSAFVWAKAAPSSSCYAAPPIFPLWSSCLKTLPHGSTANSICLMVTSWRILPASARMRSSTCGPWPGSRRPMRIGAPVAPWNAATA